MSSKHNPLTEAEVAAHHLNAVLAEKITSLGFRPGAAILDWGCGRGLSVVALRDRGYEAVGIDIDERTLNNGRSLLTARGLAASEILLSHGRLGRFGDGSFHLIFSEEVLEHVEDLDADAKEMFRLTAQGGLGIHLFPAPRRWREPHLQIPVVHWFPKHPIRKVVIAAGLLLGMGPSSPWPETRGLDLWSTVTTYYDYLASKTHYRDIRDVARIFRRAGFTVAYSMSPTIPFWARLFPRRWKDNGFPHGSVMLLLRKQEAVTP